MEIKCSLCQLRIFQNYWQSESLMGNIVFAFPLVLPAWGVSFVSSATWWFLIHQFLRASCNGSEGTKWDGSEGNKKTRQHGTSRYIFVTMAPPWRQPIWGYLCAQANEQRETKASSRTKRTKHSSNNIALFKKKRDSNSAKDMSIFITNKS